MVKRVLEHKHHYVPFPEEKHKVLTEPFFRNFHGQIPIGDKVLNSVLEEEEIGPHTSGQCEDVNGSCCFEDHSDHDSTSTLEMNQGDVSSEEISMKPLKPKSSVETEPDPPKGSEMVKPPDISPQGDEASTCTEEYSISKGEWQLIQSKIDQNNVELDYDCDQTLLVVKSKYTQGTHKFLRDLKRLQIRIHSKCLSIGEGIKMLLMSNYAGDYFTSQFPDVQWYIKNKNLHIYSFNMSEVEEFEYKIRHLKVDFEKAALEDKLSEDDQLSYQNYASRTSFVQISSNAKETTIMGVQKYQVTNLEKSRLPVCPLGDNSFGKTFTLYDTDTTCKTSFEFSDFYYNFLYTHHKDELDQALKCVASSSIHSNCGRTSIEFLGAREDVKKAVNILGLIQLAIQKELMLCLKAFADSGLMSAVHIPDL